MGMDWNAPKCRKENDMSDEDWKNFDPWVVFDSDSKLEWLLPQPLRYYVCEDSDGTWFVCDRVIDCPLQGTQTKTRGNTIRRFYELFNRKIPIGVELPQAVPGVSHHGYKR
jgi:hypothetical protein